MTNLKGKIDFAVIISATNANPNGDPLNGNRPIALRTLARRYLYSLMTELMMDITV